MTVGHGEGALQGVACSAWEHAASLSPMRSPLAVRAGAEGFL
jgi:hypothetical protein